MTHALAAGPYKRLKVSRWSYRRAEGHVAHATRLLEDFEAPPQEIALPFGSLLTAEEFEVKLWKPVFIVYSFYCEGESISSLYQCA